MQTFLPLYDASLGSFYLYYPWKVIQTQLFSLKKGQCLDATIAIAAWIRGWNALAIKVLKNYNKAQPSVPTKDV